MQEKLNKWIWIIIPILLLGAFLFYLYDKTQVKEYTSHLFYMDTYIYVKIYEKDEKKAKMALQEVGKIYQKYHQLTNRYEEYEGINNIYFIKYNNLSNETLKLDSELYDMIAYGKEMYQKSKGLVDISMGNIIDVWKKYRDVKTGIPTKEELEVAHTNKIDDIVLLDHYQIQNNHPNIDLGAIAKGYTTEVACKYLESIGISHYLVNAGGNVKVGIPSGKDKFKIGLEDPNSQTGEVFQVIEGKNISVVTSGGYERYYEYNGIRYHHIIHPETLYPPNYMKSVSVITEDSKLGDLLSTYLFLMPIEEGKQYIESLDNVEAIWYTNENNVVTSSGMIKYE